MSYFSITSQIIVNEAKSLGFEVEILEPSKNFYVVRGNGKEIYFKSNDFGGNSSLGYKIAEDKELTSLVLGRKGYNIPKSIYLEKEESNSFSLFDTDLKFPLVTKPVDEGHGNGVTVGIENIDELNRGINEAFKFGNRIIIQEFIEGEEYRILVIGNQKVFGIKRIPVYVIGDSNHTIEELISIENKNPYRGDIQYTNSLSKIIIDQSLIDYIGKKGFLLNYIPSLGEYIQLRGVSNIGAGGIPVDITKELSEEFKNECIGVSKVLGLEVLGIDVITRDISKSLKSSGGIIIELGSNPGFGGASSTGINIGLELLKVAFGI